jgi:pilus assembly protein CpaF
VVRLEIRPPNIEGKGEVTPRMLVRNSLRMRPDRIIVGEVRGAEVVDMLQAMNTGHEGSMATVHANTPRDALTRLENMIGMAGFNLPPKAMREQISSALTAIIHISRLSDGKRKVTSIQEITGMEGDVITMQDIFTYEQTGIGPDGTVLGHFRATGIRPRFVDRLRVHGITVSDELFDPTKLYD